MKKLIILIFTLIITYSVFFGQNQDITNKEFQGYYIGITTGLNTLSYSFTYRYFPDLFGYQISINPIIEYYPNFSITPIINVAGLMSINKNKNSSIFLYSGLGLLYYLHSDSNELSSIILKYFFRKNSLSFHLGIGPGFEYYISKNIAYNIIFGFNYYGSYNFDLYKFNYSFFTLFIDFGLYYRY